METPILKIYKSKNTIFTFEELAILLNESNISKLKSKINYYIKSKKLIRIKKGIYARDKNFNKFELAVKLYSPSYISLETALQKYGVISQYYNDIFLISYLRREIKINGLNISYRKIKDTVLVNKKGIIEKESYFIADKERAFLDALYLYKDYYFDNLRNLDWEKCFYLAEIYENKSLINRLNSYYKLFKNA